MSHDIIAIEIKQIKLQELQEFARDGYSMLSAGRLLHPSQATIQRTFAKFRNKPAINCILENIENDSITNISESIFKNSPIFNFELFGATKSAKLPWRLQKHKKNEFTFNFTIDNGQVIDIESYLGFNYRKIEQTLRSKSIKESIPIIQRVCGLCANNHLLAYCSLVEKNLGVYDQISECSNFIRIIITELERVTNHLLWLATTLHGLNLTSLFKAYWMLRQNIENYLIKLQGDANSIIVVGGVDMDISIINKLQRQLNEWIMKFQEIGESNSDEMRKLISYTESKAQLTKTDLSGSVGTTGRSANVDNDIRKHIPYANYQKLKLENPETVQGDLFSLIQIRIEEITSAFDLVNQCDIHISNLEKSKSQLRIDTSKKDPVGEVQVSLIEAPGGALQYTGKISSEGYFDQLHINIPTINNIQSLVSRINKNNIQIIPLAFKSIEMGMSPGTDLVFTNNRTQEVKKVTIKQLQKLSTESLEKGTDLKFNDL